MKYSRNNRDSEELNHVPASVLAGVAVIGIAFWAGVYVALVAILDMAGLWPR